MEYKRPDVGLKIYREALARFTEFSNLRLGVYTPYAHEKRIQTLKKRPHSVPFYENRNNIFIIYNFYIFSLLLIITYC